MIILLYKEIDKVTKISKETFEKVIAMFPEASKIYEIIREFKEIMFSKKYDKLEMWIKKTREFKIREIDSFLNSIERDLETIKNV